MSSQAEILLTIHMEIEGSGGADSHINLIYHECSSLFAMTLNGLRHCLWGQFARHNERNEKQAHSRSLYKGAQQFLVVSPERILSLLGQNAQQCLFVYLKFYNPCGWSLSNPLWMEVLYSVFNCSLTYFFSFFFSSLLFSSPFFFSFLPSFLFFKFVGKAKVFARIHFLKCNLEVTAFNFTL